MTSKIKNVLLIILAIICAISLTTGVAIFLFKHNQSQRNEAYNAIPTYEEVIIDYMDTNEIERDSEYNIRINRHYKANENTLVYCGQNTIDFYNIISFYSIYVFESKQVEIYVLHRWSYKGSYEI